MCVCVCVPALPRDYALLTSGAITQPAGQPRERELNARFLSPGKRRGAIFLISLVERKVKQRERERKYRGARQVEWD